MAWMPGQNQQPAADATEVEEAPKKRKKKRLPKIIPTSDAGRLLDVVARDAMVSGEERIRNRLALELMYRAGLRVSEVCKIRPRQVHEDGRIEIFDGKGGDGTAYFSIDDVWPQLETWLTIRARWTTDPDAPLFVMPGGRPMNTRYFQRLIKRLKETAGIRGICTPHVLRHSFATELLEEGLSITEVQSALRHANLQTTAVYLHVRDEALRRKISQRGRREVNE